MAVAALVLGIVGLVMSFIPCLGAWGLLLTIPGLVLGFVAIGKAKKTNAPKGAAIAGVVTSLIGSLIAAWWIYAMCFAVSETNKTLNQWQRETDKASSFQRDAEKATAELEKAISNIKL